MPSGSITPSAHPSSARRQPASVSKAAVAGCVGEMGTSSGSQPVRRSSTAGSCETGVA